MFRHEMSVGAASGIAGARPVPTLLTIPAACAALAISRSKLFMLLRDGALCARKIGRGTRIERDSLERFIAGLPDARYRPPVTRPLSASSGRSRK